MGDKVGFTGKATQERFKIPSPAMGVLFAPMFIPDGGSIQHDFGHRTIIEPDLMVVVKDEGIMDATTELEAAAHLDTVHAELVDEPDLKIARINTSFVEGRLSYFDLHYLIGTLEGTEHVVERHELGLFTTDEITHVLTNCGFEVTYDAEGLMDRGLYIGRRLS